ncbi:MAG: type II toxin-antitoxin system VapC family toxin [Candidatus Aenigmarchaeota archaeon]|nr:type II toxin-antitoxin system VapC family toxin [Candidatus Aenigmarchaeota archaeon]
METKVVLDTNVIVDFLRNKSEIIRRIHEMRLDGVTFGTTHINVFELFHGAYKSSHTEKNLSAVKGFLKSVFLLGTTPESMEIAAKMLAELERKGLPIEMRDILIASICLVSSFAIMTKNVSHFERIPGLEIIKL